MPIIHFFWGGFWTSFFPQFLVLRVDVAPKFFRRFAPEGRGFAPVKAGEFPPPFDFEEVPPSLSSKPGLIPMLCRLGRGQEYSFGAWVSSHKGRKSWKVSWDNIGDPKWGTGHWWTHSGQCRLRALWLHGRCAMIPHRTRWPNLNASKACHQWCIYSFIIALIMFIYLFNPSFVDLFVCLFFILFSICFFVFFVVFYLFIYLLI